MEYPENPPLECDVVMKGGITSGVIYPRAVCRLAMTYRLRSVGGASAGAIAAAAAAAAELGRATGGFEYLENLPTVINAPSPAGESTLFRLFQPTRATYPLYRAFTAGMGKSSKIVSTLVALASGFWLWALAGASPGIAVIVVSALGSGPARWAGIVGGLLLAALGKILGIAAGIAKILAGVPNAGFGLCTGMPGAGSNGAAALTPWLHEQLQAISGKQEVLTFGDLAEGGVDLRMMTTNLNRHQPMAMPWSTQEYFFDPKEMRRLFPEDVVRCMEEHPPAHVSDGKRLPPSEIRRRDLLREQALPLRPFPAPLDVPVVVATRMSLSFPLLITAVPLHAIDYSVSANRDARKAAEDWLRDNPNGGLKDAAARLPDRGFAVNWFSDGGICSNLPVHFFDAPLPTRPTFAVDLAPFPPDRAESDVESENTYLPTANAAGQWRTWSPIPKSGLKALKSFLLEIVDTARGWVDAGQLVMPGYRDRIVTIWHTDKQGGMNLAMPEPVVTKLADRGEAAAAKLVAQFAGSQPGVEPTWGWDNDRWIRFRTATAGLEAWLEKFREKYAMDAPGATLYSRLAGPGANAEVPSYKPTEARRTQVNKHTEELLDMADAWAGDDAMAYNAPRPRPRMRLVPDDGTAAGLAAADAEQVGEVDA
jgi:predicted acylesterase/phospholipase RssA